jgi:hypothetical protein
MTLKLDLPSELEHKLHREAQMAGVGESEFALRVIEDRLTHGSATLSEDEELLLREIDRGFSDPWWERYAQLVRKREDEALSELERRELSVLTEALEEYNVRRISCLAGVAKRHGIALDELMKQLDLKPRSLD